MILTNKSHHSNLTAKVAPLAGIFHFNVSRGIYAESPAKAKQTFSPLVCVTPYLVVLIVQIRGYCYSRLKD